ncbi:MAG: 1-deoxy-D-xylulose-5-phosphate reductoisomerase [Oscillospiraceae bacterium]|nr:1-deoxy-D-xylulose-5-phosphate reductoisomerase [Oscillospiraceae bacterium]
MNNKTLTILGSTGSIGVQSLEVARAKGYKIAALAAGKNIKLVEQQIREFAPITVAMSDEKSAIDLKIRIADTNTKVLSGSEGVCEVAITDMSDIVLNAIVGIAGLAPTMAAINSKKDIALANKETLVAGGDIVINAAKNAGIKILPVDSEHSAIFQCLQGIPQGSLKNIILTASGGPFFGKKREELINIKPEQALKHPNWNMGAKITIDSASLMNKGLEVIEAVHLFNVSPERIHVLVHRQSIIHSAIELIDGAIIAQLGAADMKLPIQYALTFPNRSVCPSHSVDLAEIATLTFDKPDMQTFTCLKTCIDAINQGGVKPAAANGANEKAVELFLKGKIGFLQIGDLVQKACDASPNIKNFTLDDVYAADKSAREYVMSCIK